MTLISSVLVHYGSAAAHDMLPELDILLRKNYKNVVVMLFDGMGTSILKKHLPADAFLIRYLQTTISSVFPATTTAASVTMESGLSPIEHGWLGWRLYFDEVGANVDIFPNTLPETDGVPAADYHVAWRYLPYKSVQEKIARQGARRHTAFLRFRHGTAKAWKKYAIPWQACAAETGKNISILTGISQITTYMVSGHSMSKSPRISVR